MYICIYTYSNMQSRMNGVVLGLPGSRPVKVQEEMWSTLKFGIDMKGLKDFNARVSFFPEGGSWIQSMAPRFLQAHTNQMQLPKQEHG